MTVIIETLKPQYAKVLERLQRACFPTLHESELLREAHFLKHFELFPEGNFVAFCDGKVVGLGSGFLIDFDFNDPHTTLSEIIDGGFYSKHTPDGMWYYGGDISVHPHYRRRGIGSKLYESRKGVVTCLNRKGIVAGGLIPGYADYKSHLSAHEYVEKVITGELYDRTLSFQLSHDFKLHGLLENYIEDNASDNWSTLIVWENPDYSA